MTCNTCKANKVCNHDIFGFEDCGNYIPDKADYVEVVFCGKCKYWKRMGFDPIFEKEFGHCHNNDFPFMCETRPDTNADDFCSYGERE